MMNKTDKQVFNEIFKALRKKGFIARQNYMCCQSCGWASIESEYDITDDSNVVFYHNQDYNAFKDGNLEYIIYLAWSGDGQTIKETFEEFGFNVLWDGSEHKRIGILPRKDVYEVKYINHFGDLKTEYAMNENDLERIKNIIQNCDNHKLIEVNIIKNRAIY